MLTHKIRFMGGVEESTSSVRLKTKKKDTVIPVASPIRVVDFATGASRASQSCLKGSRCFTSDYPLNRRQAHVVPHFLDFLTDDYFYCPIDKDVKSSDGEFHHKSLIGGFLSILDYINLAHACRETKHVLLCNDGYKGVCPSIQKCFSVEGRLSLANIYLGARLGRSAALSENGVTIYRYRVVRQGFYSTPTAYTRKLHNFRFELLRLLLKLSVEDYSCLAFSGNMQEKLLVNLPEFNELPSAPMTFDRVQERFGEINRNWNLWPIYLFFVLTLFVPLQ